MASATSSIRRTATLLLALLAGTGAGTPPRTDMDRGTEALAGIRDDIAPGPWVPLAVPGAAQAETLLVTHLEGPAASAGYGTLFTVQGKDQPITVLLVTDTALTVIAVEIVTYREPYGGEIRRASWRQQFAGAGPDDPLRHGRDILNISGATISARAVTDGVRLTLDRLNVLRPRLRMETRGSL